MSTGVIVHAYSGESMMRYQTATVTRVHETIDAMALWASSLASEYEPQPLQTCDTNHSVTLTSVRRLNECVK